LITGIYLFQSQEELQEYCRHHEINYVALVSDKEGSHVKVKTAENVSWLTADFPSFVLSAEHLLCQQGPGWEPITSLLPLNSWASS
jgi:hypothetical protein